MKRTGGRADGRASGSADRPSAGPSDARAAALAVLLDIRRGAPFDVALGRAVERLETVDRRLAHELAAGVLRHQARLDALIVPHVTRGWKEVQTELQMILRIGTYQLAVLDRIPVHAAVDSSVALAKARAGARAGGFVNAVLRRVANGEPEQLEIAAVTPEGARRLEADRLAETYSHPAWLVRRYAERFGFAEVSRLLSWNNAKPPLVLQPARRTLSEIAAKLRAAGVRVHPAPFGAGLIVDGTRPTELPGFAEGDFLIQDAAQALVLWFADMDPGARVYDACAAPGGKAIGLGRTAGVVLAADRQIGRLARLRENIGRAGSGREFPIVADAAHPPIRAADVVLLDAPCLGTGTFARHPDARLRVSELGLVDLADRQSALLDAVAGAVRPGGLLVYSTCSLEPEENAQQVDAFLARHPEFRRDPNRELPAVLLTEAGDLELLPQRHGVDGAFAARLRRAPVSPRGTTRGSPGRT